MGSRSPAIRAKRVPTFVAAIAIVVWSLATLVFGVILVSEFQDVGRSDPSNCPGGPGTSTHFASHWSWLPPGPVCEYPSGDVGPSYWNIPEAILFVVFPVIWVPLLLWRQLARVVADSDRSRDPSDDP